MTLRRRLRADRAAYVAGLRTTQALRGAEVAAAERLLDHVPAGIVVALYSAFGDELDPGPLGLLLHARGHALALPYVGPDRTTMRFIAWTPGESLVPGAFGLNQPDPASADIAPDLIVTPLVGFDRAGGRIGQGAGYYDRAFVALPGARRIGLAWSVQEVASIPLDPWDVPLHAVATEREWIACEGME
jgi:5-formyltetrahydrofolate cyclo-ligase